MTRGDIDVEVIYRPTDLIVMQELHGKMVSEETSNEINELAHRYGEYHYFVLSYSMGGREALYAGSQDYGQFSENLQKLAFRMQEYLYMTTDRRDTVQLADFYYPRMHGMGTATQLLLVFSKEAAGDSEVLKLHIKDVGFGTGRMHFNFDVQDIRKVPRIEQLVKIKEDPETPGNN